MIMIKEYLPKPGMKYPRYIYETFLGKIYVLKERFNVPVEKITSPHLFAIAERRLQREAIYQISGHKNIVEEEKKKKLQFRLGILAFSLAVGTLSYNSAPYISKECEKVKINYQIDSYKEKLKEIPDKKVNELLQSVETLIEKNHLSEELYDEMIFECLFDDYATKEEAFIHYMQNSIDASRAYTKEEKEALIKEYTEMIKAYGKYYNGKSTLNAIKQVSQNMVIRDDYAIKPDCNVYHDQVYVHYNPDNIKAMKELHHEINISEDILISQDTCPFYQEAKASVLSDVGSSDALVVISVMCMIAGEDKILPPLINRNYDEMWANFSSNFGESVQNDIVRLRSYLEHMNVYRVYQTQGYEDVYEILFRLVQIKQNIEMSFVNTKGSSRIKEKDIYHM